MTGQHSRDDPLDEITATKSYHKVLMGKERQQAITCEVVYGALRINSSNGVAFRLSSQLSTAFYCLAPCLFHPLQLPTRARHLMVNGRQAWTAQREIRAMDTARIAVVGAGVIGLSTAVCISQLVPRCSVTVISDKFTPDTTSNVAAGMLIPHTYPDTPVPTQKQWFTETFQHLSAIAESTEAADAGVHLVSGWQVFRNVPTEEVPFWADVVLGFRKMTEAELKRFPQYVSGQAFTTLKCETSAYLPWLEKRVKEGGGLLLTRRIEDLWELQPSFDIVVNCSGLGSRQLVGDSKISPVRGQVLQAYYTCDSALSQNEQDGNSKPVSRSSFDQKASCDFLEDVSDSSPGSAVQDIVDWTCSL
ncbi:hypothetical protein STEG23_027453, partial [Scotinomys teguina]